MRRLGASDEKIAAVQQAIIDKSVFAPQEIIALELADRMVESGHAVDDALWQQLLQFFTQDELIEIVCSIGLFNYFNRVNDTLHMEITR